MRAMERFVAVLGGLLGVVLCGCTLQMMVVCFSLSVDD